MKTYFKYFAFITFVTLSYSCNKEAMPTIESPVEISANITPCILTRVTDDGTAFSNGDNIKVQNINRTNKNIATYTYSSSTAKWSTTDELYWDGEDANTFYAWYPTTAAYDSFTILVDQTSGTAAADWMTATASAKKADGNVELSFNHNLAKVTITIERWGNGYAANEKTINSLEIKSLSSVISNNGTLSGDNAAKWINTYVSLANTSFAAIIAPGTYTSDAEIMQVYVNESSTPLKVKTTSSINIESGKAYSLKLTIGKDLAEIASSVEVGAWGDETLNNQHTSALENKYIDEEGNEWGYGIEIDGVIWAPVNCGYHNTDYPHGKLYQWGRKYGQGYDEEFTKIFDKTYPTEANGGLVAGPVSINTGLDAANKNIFYMRSDDGKKWWFDNIDEDSYYKLWNSGTNDNPIKASNDPCPEGWRMPTSKELENLIKKHSIV